jgi:hypothetical protein
MQLSDTLVVSPLGMRKLVARINHSSNLILKYTSNFKVKFRPAKGRRSFYGVVKTREI